MSEALSPGLNALIELTKDDPKTPWLIEQLDQLGRRALGDEKVSPHAFMATLSSTIGYMIGDGARRRRNAKALDEAILLAQCILEDSAQDAFKKI